MEMEDSIGYKLSAFLLALHANTDAAASATAATAAASASVTQTELSSGSSEADRIRRGEMVRVQEREAIEREEASMEGLLDALHSLEAHTHTPTPSPAPTSAPAHTHAPTPAHTSAPAHTPAPTSAPTHTPHTPHPTHTSTHPTPGTSTPNPTPTPADTVLADVLHECRRKFAAHLRPPMAEAVRASLTVARKRLASRAVLDSTKSANFQQRHLVAMVELLGCWSNIATDARYCYYYCYYYYYYYYY
jgi:hypothetical protein